MKLLLVCGPGGSGTTAVAGVLDNLGAIGFGPYLHTNDERTRNCYELIPFRDIVRRCISEETMSPRSGMDIKSELQNFRQRIMNQELGPYDISAGVPIFLKEPFSAVIIPQISEIFDTRLIYVLRPFAEIEATRVRRAWGFTFSGARVIYSHMFFDLVNYRIPTLIVRFPDLIACPVEQVMQIAEFSGLKANPTTILAASNFIATHRLTYGQGNGRTAVA